MSSAVTSQPPHVLVMGVSGCGKSTIAEALADHIGAQFADADDFHSEEAKALMASGTSLTDEQRLPWIKRLKKHLETMYDERRPVVLACSLLRKAHREQIYQSGLPVLLIYLEGDKALIRKRLTAREGHFFPASLLDKQFEDLQPPTQPEPFIALDISQSVDALVDTACHHLVELKK